MVAIKILRAKEEEEENEELCSASWSQLSRSSGLSFFSKNSPCTFWFKEYLYSTKVLLKPPESSLSETEYFKLKKESRLGEKCWRKDFA